MCLGDGTRLHPSHWYGCQSHFKRLWCDLAEALAAGEQAKIEEAAALAVKEVLIPAFEAFIGGISKAAGFFSVMEHELQKFENNAKRSEDDPQFIFFKIMKVEATDIKSVCQVFYAALPDVKTDFEAMPTEGTDRNYVDEWLGKQKKMIEEECKGKLAKNMLSAIADAVEKKMRWKAAQAQKVPDSSAIYQVEILSTEDDL